VTSPATHVVNLPLSDAVEELTGFEVLAIESYFGRDLNDLGSLRTLLGTVWVYRNRNGQKTDWTAVKAMTLKELQAYFAPSPDEPEPEGLSAEGKENAPGSAPS
jgi:hypothetical protein